MAQKRTIDWMINNYMPLFEKFGVKEQNIRNDYKNTWQKELKDSNIDTYLIAIFNYLINENYKQSKVKNLDLKGFYERNRDVYQEMVLFKRKYKKQKVNHIHKLYNENYIKALAEDQSDLILDAVIICGGTKCIHTESLSGKKISLEEAIENTAIPYDECSSEYGCCCTYGLKPRRGEEGNLIFKEEIQNKKTNENKSGFWSRLFS